MSYLFMLSTSGVSCVICFCFLESSNSCNFYPFLLYGLVHHARAYPECEVISEDKVIPRGFTDLNIVLSVDWEVSHCLYMTLTFDPTYKILIYYISGRDDPFEIERKLLRLIWCCPNFTTFTVDSTNDIDVGFSSSHFEMSVIEEWIVCLMSMAEWEKLIYIYFFTKRSPSEEYPRTLWRQSGLFTLNL